MGIEIEGYWSDVGTIEQYRMANFDAARRRVKLGLSDAKPYREHGRTTIGDRTVIEYGCDIAPAVFSHASARLFIFI